MQFYVVGRYSHPPSDAVFPCVVLEENSWNDWGYQTLFQFQYWTEDKYIEFEHGVKIMNQISGSAVGRIPRRFDRLEEDFCCLGQSVDYYRDIAKLDREDMFSILSAINDVVYNRSLLDKFQEHPAFQKSLLRFIEADKALDEGAFYVLGNNPDTRRIFRFSLSTLLKGADAPHQIDFDFAPTLLDRERIIVMIGDNGAGKTQVLARIANTISGYLPMQAEITPQRPKFSKVIAVSYSAFDQFERPPRNTDSYSYVYCGIMDEDRVKSRAQILGELIIAVDEIAKKSRQDVWRRVASEVFMESLWLRDEHFRDEQFLANLFARMSSGQRVLLLVLSQMISQLEEESIVLYDEPELHLHPRWISGILDCLYLLLDHFNSYAIVATHSPIVLQQIPSRNVRVFRRVGNIPVVSALMLESFGENLTVITGEVFERGESDENYQKIIQEWSRRMTMEQVLSEFSGKLGFNALAAVYAAYSERGRGEL